MNKNINHGSLEEIQAFDDRKMMENMSPEERREFRRRLIETMKGADPGAKKAHALAQSIAKEEENERPL